MSGRFLLLLGLARIAFGQSGHWEGVIKQPDRDYLFTVDLDNNPDWHGTFSIPGQEAPPLPLAAIEIDPPNVRFEVLEIPGDPTFKGKIAEQGSDIKGVVVQSGQTLAFQMLRTGDARVPSIRANTPLQKAFLGDWHGALAFQPPLELVVHLKEDEQGLAEGTLDSGDRRARNLILSAIQQEGADLSFDVRLIGGRFRGVLSADETRIEGVWTQQNRRMALIFTRFGK